VKGLTTMCALLVAASAVPPASAFRGVELRTADGGEVHANLYEGGGHAVVLAHGRVFDKESWHEQARELQRRGFTVLAIDFRGYGRSRTGSVENGLDLDVLAAIDYLRSADAELVSVVGGSMGAGFAGLAAQKVPAGDLHKLVLLAPPAFDGAAQMRADQFLFIVSEGDGVRLAVEQLHHQAPEPKALETLPGEAHAQHLFKTDQAEPLLDLIATFLAKSD
jgi:pimeloyl-ACP methyl ester carboxylesterase